MSKPSAKAVARLQLIAQERHTELERKRIERLEDERVAAYISEIEAFLARQGDER
jgi:hypothetical protein